MTPNNPSQLAPAQQGPGGQPGMQPVPAGLLTPPASTGRYTASPPRGPTSRRWSASPPTAKRPPPPVPPEFLAARALALQEQPRSAPVAGLLEHQSGATTVPPNTAPGLTVTAGKASVAAPPAHLASTPNASAVPGRPAHPDPPNPALPGTAQPPIGGHHGDHLGPTLPDSPSPALPSAVQPPGGGYQGAHAGLDRSCAPTVLDTPDPDSTQLDDEGDDVMT
jgi:hypothetical protein